MPCATVTCGWYGKLQLARHRPGGVPDLLLQPGAGLGPLDDLHEHDGRQRAEGSRAGQPHREGPAGRRDLGEVRLDRRQRGALDLSRRQQRDMGGDAVSRGVAEARAQLLELAAVGLRDRDRHTDRYGPHVVSCRRVMRVVVCPSGGAVRRTNYRLYGHGGVPGRRSGSDVRRCRWCDGWCDRRSGAEVVRLSAWRAGSPPCRTPGRASPRRRRAPSRRPWPGSSRASPGRPDTAGCAPGTASRTRPWPRRGPS